MPDAVYPKYALRATGENQLNLSDAEQIYLRDCLDNQLISNQISGIPQEIVLAIYRQTIRYNKREDDLCGSRIADLISTKSSAHYCNCHVRELIEQSILIMREGFYGRILSINFNFSQWGKTPEENGTLISDPEGFCAEHSHDLVPAISSSNPSTEEQTEVQIKAQTKAQIEVQDEPTPEQAQIGRLEKAIQTLSGEVATLTALLQNALPNLLPPPENAKKPETVVEEAESIPTSCPTENPHTPSFASRKNTVSNAPALQDKNTQNDKKASQDQDASTSVQHTQIASVNDNKPATEITRNDDKTPDDKTPQDQHVNVSTLHSITACENKNHNEEKDNLTFPEELKPHEKNAICKALEAEKIKDKSTCQLLLDDLSSRFKISDWQPIRSPIAYFRSLIRSYKQGTFDNSYVEDFRNKQKAAEATQKEAQNTAERRAYLDKYNEAKNNYENLKVAAQGLGRTLREIATDRGWAALIEEMGFDLDAPVPTFD